MQETNLRTASPEASAAGRRLSRKRMAANRRNAQRSTGPRTASGKSRSRMNALKHGAHARVIPLNLIAEPASRAQYADLLLRLTAAHRPADTSEQLLVEDIAGLRWQRRRAERAQAALQAQALEALELERRRRALEMRKRFPAGPYLLALRLGMGEIKDSPGRFHHLISYLEALIGAIQLPQLPPGIVEMARSIYGPTPSAQGGLILAGLERIVEASASSPPDASALGELERMLRSELRAAEEAFEIYKSEHMEISPSAADACLAPKGPEWEILLRMLSQIDRNIERKTRLLLQMQNARRQGWRGSSAEQRRK